MKRKRVNSREAILVDCSKELRAVIALRSKKKKDRKKHQMETYLQAKA